MRRSYFLFLLALFLGGCSRGQEERPAAPTIEKAQAGGSGKDESKTAAAAESERDLAIQLARLTKSAEKHERRGYFDQAAAARKETLALIEKRYGADAWQTRSARLALSHSARLQKLNAAQKSVYLNGEAEEASAQQNWKRGARPTALAEIAHARAGAQHLWGPADYTVGNLLDQEAEWRQAAGENAAAEKLARQALAIREQVFTREHPDTIASISRLGLILQMEKKYTEAEPLLAEAAQRSGVLWGETHIEYARQLNNLGMLEYDRMNLPLAIETLNKALEIRQKNLPANDPLIAHSLFNLGSAYFASKDYAAASPRLQQALNLFSPALGESHAMTSLARANLGMSLLAEKKFAEAEILFRQDIKISQRAFGAQSPAVAEGLLRLGVLFCNQGRYPEAEPLVTLAVAIDRAALGMDHPVTKQAEQVAGLVRERLAAKANQPAKVSVIQAAGQVIPQEAAPAVGPVLTPVPFPSNPKPRDGR
ncbi:MAG TPA: tetratricopeptide repeat protein [Pirellulales bacterium]|jgi:tetratricopeptide (TPR) repeat protein